MSAALPIDPAALGALLAVVFLAVARTTALLLITPFLGRGVLTGMARNGVVLAFSLPVVPRLYGALPAQFDPSNLLLMGALLVKEMLIGLLLGLPVAAISWGVEAAGYVIDTQRGATSASALDPATGNQSSPLGILLAQVYTVWLFIGGGLLLVLDLLYRSHEVWPAWEFLPALSQELPRQMLHLLDSVLSLTFLVSGPALVAMFLSEAGLALVSRFAPQLQVFFLAMPVKSALGLLALALGLSVLQTAVAERLGTADSLLDMVRHWLP